MRISRFELLGAFLIGLAAGPAYGAITTYSNLADWNNGVVAPNTIDFNSLSGYIHSHSQSGVTFTPLMGTTYWLHPGAPTWWASCNVWCLATDDSGPNRSILATMLNSSTMGFGLNLFANFPGVQPITVRTFLVGNATATPDRTDTISTDRANAAFYGLTSDLAIAKVEIIATGSNHAVIDNFRLASALSGGGTEPPPSTDTPEVPTLGYIGIGFVAMLLGRRRRLSQ